MPIPVVFEEASALSSLKQQTSLAMQMIIIKTIVFLEVHSERGRLLWLKRFAFENYSLAYNRRNVENVIYAGVPAAARAKGLHRRSLCKTASNVTYLLKYTMHKIQTNRFFSSASDLSQQFPCKHYQTHWIPLACSPVITAAVNILNIKRFSLKIFMFYFFNFS